ncbi:YhjD/YihY/BrkB family envelope integrity protein [Solirubrobacter soli]|uniref:YhjD/YihY/BrkB family envelope integrity protein n=1 Tax=Solirubrobacter soli TaxID=363832 RepID=UPI00040D3310|nr:YhjD/YihY/BrkB family envelope integrity protein [Solirubrobacter soli]
MARRAAADASPSRAWADKGRVFKTLTFWLRPAFVLRVINRFQKVAGFDRAIALASSGLTAAIPLTIALGTVMTSLWGTDIADWIVKRYELTGAGARAVEDAFTPADDASVTVMGLLLALLAALSFTRTLQRVFESTWDLSPLSYRNTLNGLRWTAVFAAYALVTGAIHAFLGQDGPDVIATFVTVPIAGVFLLWSAYWLSAKRISHRALAPFAIIGSIALAIYGLGAAIYVPRQFTTYADHYGVLGAVLAIISALFCVMFVVVAAATLGREIHDELEKIRHGQRPPDDEVRQEWDNVMAEAHTRWEGARKQLDNFRERRSSKP